MAGPGLAVGHLHLHVGDLQRGLAFYRDVLGFELMALIPGGAAFVSAGGYHHLDLNVWRGEGVPPVPAGRVGLRHWTVVLDDPEEVEAVRERVRAAGVEVEEGEGDGFIVRDPWDIATVFTRNSRRGGRAELLGRRPYRRCAPTLSGAPTTFVKVLDRGYAGS